MKNDSIKKVLVIGSGPIVIGQAAEFDYSGTQACEALREEGIEVVLINSNPATIMTDSKTADKIYIEPMNIQTIEKIIVREKPDSLLPGMGGQTALNLAVELKDAGILEKYNVNIIGTSIESIKKGEMDATVDSFPLYKGQIAVEMALRTLGGQQLPRVIWTPQALIDSTNVNEPSEKIINWKEPVF